MQVTLKTFKLAILLAVAFGGFARYAEAAGEGGFVRGCYFTTWSRYRQGYGKYTVKNVPKGLCTHVLGAFAKVDSSGNTLPFDPDDFTIFDQLTSLKKSDPGLKVLLSYGGWSFGSGTFSEVARSPAKRKAMIQSAIAFIRQHNFDGFDLDWEYPLGVAQYHAKLAQELRAAFDSEASSSGKPRLLLTAAVAAGRDNIQQGYDIKSMARSFDYIFLMSYDLHGSWERATGLHAQLRGNGDLTTAAAAKIWVDGGMPKKKVIIGIPTYSRGWTLQSSASTGIGAPATGASSATATYPEGGGAAYWEICEMIKSGGQEHVDKTNVGAYMVKGNQWHGYDNPETVAIKMAWLKGEGYGGAFIWALDTDDFAGGKCGKGAYPILSAISSGLGGGAAPEPLPEPEPEPEPAPTSGPGWEEPVTTPGGAPEEPNDSSICSSNPNGYFRDRTDCTKFYQCANGTPYLLSCPAGLYFDETIATCDYKANAPPGIC